MLVTGFPAGGFAANCYVIAPAPGEECLIVDPGQDAVDGIDDILAEYRLKPVAVLLTHGHIDHVWSVAPVCGAKDIPAYIHPADRALLTDPARGFALGAGARRRRGGHGDGHGHGAATRLRRIGRTRAPATRNDEPAALGRESVLVTCGRGALDSGLRRCRLTLPHP